MAVETCATKLSLPSCRAPTTSPQSEVSTRPTGWANGRVSHSREHSESEASWALCTTGLRGGVWAVPGCLSRRSGRWNEHPLKKATETPVMACPSYVVFESSDFPQITSYKSASYQKSLPMPSFWDTPWLPMACYFLRATRIIWGHNTKVPGGLDWRTSTEF